jgi:hypothetical protein
LRRLDLPSGIALAVCLCATLLWHGIGFAVLGIGFAVLWLLWRATSLRERILGVAPTVPALLQCAAWMAATFGSRAGPSRPPSWKAPLEAADSIVEYVWTSIPHAQGLALILGLVIGCSLVIGQTNVGAAHAESRMWRMGNPLLALSLVYLVAYFVFPAQWSRVEGVSTRFAYPAALAFVFAWNLPSRQVVRSLVIASVLAFSAFCLHDITERFRAFDVDTRGASALIDEVGLHETLYSFPGEQGASKDFAPGHSPLRELQQYATIRKGGLPNSSFAGYGINYVAYVEDRNPMPGLAGPPRWSGAMTRFDYVLTRGGQGPSDPRFLLVDRNRGWELYGVCGSNRFPTCS